MLHDESLDEPHVRPLTAYAAFIGNTSPSDPSPSPGYVIDHVRPLECGGDRHPNACPSMGKAAAL